jgi:hypothetical protein
MSLAVTSRYIRVMHSDTDPCVAALERAMANNETVLTDRPWRRRTPPAPR